MNSYGILGSKRLSLIFVAVLCIALGASLAVNLANNSAYAVDKAATAEEQRAALRNIEGAFTSIVDDVLPSVVSITSKRTVSTREAVPWFDEEFFKNFPFRVPQPGVPQKQPVTSYGSGVIVKAEGYILTNDHVVGGADKVTITLRDGREFEGTVLRDYRSDLALIKIDAKKLPAARLGDSEKVKVGSWAIAVGSPFRLSNTVTVGVISGVGRQEAASGGRERRFYPNLIQTDASINPGNSGGPLLNIDGEVIGINTLIRSSFGGGNIGIGFAIPINTAKFVMKQLIEHGKVTRGYLGVQPDDLTPKMAQRYGVEKGAFVRTVEVGTPADKAGVQVEDVIVEFDGKKIEGEMELRDVVAAASPGKTADMVVVRDKHRKTLKVTLGEPPDLEVAKAPVETETKLGFGVAELTPDLIKKYGLDASTKGVVVTKITPGSSAMRAGVEPGDLIRKANDVTTKSVADFNTATEDLKSGDTLRLIIETSKRRLLVEFEID